MTDYSVVSPKVLEQLRSLLNELTTHADLTKMLAERDRVYARYGRVFAPEHLPALTAGEYLSFLRFENNAHWTGINRYGSRTVADLDALRRALAVLTDEGRPLAERYDAATGGLVKGIGRAIATPILHVVYPDRYGVWNSQSHAGLAALGALPLFKHGWTDGQRYEAINDVLLQLAEALGIDLWTLDALWEALRRRQPLAPPFDALFADRAEAEWAFDLFAETATRLSDAPNDPRFALTLPHDRTMMRLNFGMWVAIDVSRKQGKMNMTLPIVEAEALGYTERDAPFEPDHSMAVFYIPLETARQMPAELRRVYEMGMAQLRDRFAHWQGTPFKPAHSPELMAALFDHGLRARLLEQGLTLPPPPDPTPMPDLRDDSNAREFPGFTADAFAFLAGLSQNSTKAWMDAHREQWRAAVFEPMRALFADLGPAVQRRFDPYLLPDELEIAPTTRKVLAHIRKNWSARPGSEYHPYYWGAFYRQHLTRQTDAQWFVTISAEFVRFGLNFGDQAERIAAQLQGRIQAEPQQFMELVARLDLTANFEFVRTVPGDIHYFDQWSPGDDLLGWLAKGPFEILLTLPPQEVIALGPRLVDRIDETFRRLFPVYLWAVADDYATLVERYLAAEAPAAPGDEGDDEPQPAEEPYRRADFLRDTHLAPDDADELRDLLDEKRQMIFFGPPGTGKTYVARHLGRLLTGLAEPPPERLTVVQFHPAYSYEEFIEGIRPQAHEKEGRRWVEYPVLPGAFVKFCRRAAQLGDAPCVFIIDEINRGNIARIFGELMLLLEYRDLRVPLPYSGDPFFIPSNVTILGTMNTADRSIALVDFALRRRFHFYEFAADPDLLDRWLAANGAALPWLGALYRRLTEEAIDDAHFRIGPSYFMRRDLTEDKLARIWRRNVLPYLREYYFDQPPRADRWAWEGDLVRGIRSGHGQ